MSKVNMCDLCGGTTRDTDAFETIKIPGTLLPDSMPGHDATRAVDIDVCDGCQPEFVDALERLQTEMIQAATGIS